MTLHSNDGSRALVVPAVPLRKHQRRFFPTLRSYVLVARGDSRRRHETELCRQGSGRASAELVRMRGKRLVYRDPMVLMRQPHSGAREMPLKRRLGCGPGHRVHTLRGGTSPGHAHSDAPGCRVSSAGTRPEATEQALSTFQQTRGPPPQTVPPWLLCDVRCQADTRSATAGDGDGISHGSLRQLDP